MPKYIYVYVFFLYLRVLVNFTRQMRIHNPYQLNVTTELKWYVHTVACFKSVSLNNIFFYSNTSLLSGKCHGSRDIS
jgi:hypothetical protein